MFSNKFLMQIEINDSLGNTKEVEESCSNFAPVNCKPSSALYDH